MLFLELWEKSMQLVDANIVLRFILNDNEILTKKAIDIIGQNSLFCPFEVVAEIVYVLEKVYEIPRSEIEKSLITFFNCQNVSTNDIKILEQALALYSEKNIDFIDSLLCAHSIINEDIIHSFDKKINMIIKKQNRR
ncbi:MAG: PIN domain-containing protein [Bacteroidota bacterium]|nr:PIN domain-containing protein [Bacteroidota bacterium]